MTTTRENANPMTRLYDRLDSVGFNRRYVQKFVLPSWWKDEIAQNPAAYAQALSIVARNLGLDLGSLQNTNGPVVRYTLGPRRYKRQARVTEKELELAECLALRAAQIACLATPDPVEGLPASASTFRAALLSDGQRYITFEALLDACWNHGVPVLHIAHFPKGAKKMDGLAVRIDGRPAIVLACRRKHSAWLAFHLAHEMGHIGVGHLPDNSMVVDDEEQRADETAEETEANEYALELLTGKPKIQYTGSTRLNPAVLVEKATTQGRAEGTDAGALILNYAKTTKEWGTAMSALKLVEPKPNAIALIHQKMCQRLDWERTSDANQEFLQRVTGADAEA